MKKLYVVLTGLLIGLGTSFNAFGQETWYAITSEDWSTAENWTLDPAAAVKVNPEGEIPDENDNVVIKSGRTITMDANGYKASVLTVDGRLELKSTQNHQFSQIRGSGRIIMEADNFPSGNSTHFTSKNQGEGTVVFKGSSFTINSIYTFYNVDVEMNDGEVITLASDLKVNGSLDVRDGRLQINTNSSTIPLNLEILEDLSVLSGAFISVGEGDAVHQLKIHGSFFNNGEVDFSNSVQYAAAEKGAVVLHFEGAADEELIANGRTDLYRLFLNKGTDKTYQLNVQANNSDNFKLFGPVSGGVGVLDTDGDAGWERLALVLYNGTLRLNNNIDLPRLGADRNGNSPEEFNIPDGAALWIDGATVSTDQSGGGWRGITIRGMLKVSDGSFSTPPNSGGLAYYGNSDVPGSLEITGGKVYTTQLKQDDENGKFNYFQSGGELHINALSDSRVSSAVFALPEESHTFTMSGGNIFISSVNDVANNGIQIGVGEGNYNVTGGTVEIITPTLNYGSQGNEFRINSTAPFFNFKVTHAEGASGEQTVVLARDLQVLNDFTIADNTSFNGETYNLAVGQNLDVTGDFETTTLTMNGSSDGNITNNTDGSLQFNNLVIDKSDETASVLLNTGEFGIAGNLTVKRGNFNLNDREVTVNGNITLNKGNIVSDDITSGKLVLSGGGAHLLSSASEDYSMGHVELDDGAGASVSSHVVLDYFTLTSGIMDIGKYRMTVNEPIVGSGFGADKMIKTGGLASDKGLNYNFSLDRGSSVLYPVGVDDDGDEYTPATFEINNTRNISGSFAVVPVVGRHPAAKDEEFVGFEYLPLEFYWKTYKEGFSGIENNDVDLSYRYHTDQSFGGWGNMMRFLNFQKYLGEWEDEGGQRRDLNDITFDNVGEKIEGDFTVAEVGSWTGNSPFDDVHTYYSVKSGNWNDRTTWSYDGHNGDALENGYLGGWGNNQWREGDPVPGPQDIVIIADGHDVFIDDFQEPEDDSEVINGNGRSAAQIEIKEGGTLDIRNTTGQSFIDIKGNGTFRTSTGNIPDADYGDFVTSATAVFEYYGEGNMDISDVLDEYPTLRISGRDTKRAAERDLKINGDLIVTNENTTFSLSTKDEGDIDVAGDVIVEGNGKLRFPSEVMRTFNIEGDLFIRNNAQLFINNGGDEDIVHEINLYGNLFQSGGELHLTETAKGKLSFLGDESVNVETRGDINSEFYQLEVAKSALDKMVKFTGDFALTGVANGNEKPLKLTKGTAWLANSGIDINLTTGGSDFEIPSETSLIVDEDAIVRASGNNTGIWLDGLLKIDNGAKVLLNGGSNNYIEYAASGNAQIWVGNTNNITPATQLNVGAQIRRSVNTDAGVLSFVQDKAATSIVIGSKEATVANRGVFELVNEGSIFEQNEEGSVVTIGRGQTDASVPALIFDPETYSGSEESGFVIGNNNTPAGSAVGLLLSKPLNYLRVALPADASAQLQTVPGNIRGHLDIESGIFDANGLDVNLFGNLSNSGTFEPSYNTTYFKGNADQTITGDVSLHKVIKEGSATLTQAEDTEVTINDDLNILSGIVSTADNQLIVNGNLLIEAGASTQSSSATDGVVMEGSNSQLLQVEGEIGRLSVNNTNGVVVPTQGGAVNFTNQLKLDAGVLDIGRNLLVIGKDAEIVSGTAGFSEDAMIQTNLSFTDAGVQQFLPEITSATDYTIPIGSMGKYTPVVMNVSNNGNATGSIRVKAANEPHISIPLSEKNRVLHYNWTLDAEGIEDFSANFTMQAFADAVKGDGNAYISARLLDASEGYWNKYNLDGFDEDNYVLNFNFEETDDAGIDGDFTAGEEDAIPEKVQTFVTRANGPWNEASTWNVEGSGVVPSGGPRGAIVKVNHKVTVPESNFSAAAYMTALGNNGTLDFGSTFGHRLGKVKGTGRIILQRNALPAGMYDEFFSIDGGTLEFTGDTDYDVLGEITRVNHLALTGSGERRLGAADLTLSGGLTVDTISLLNESEIDLSIKGNLTFNNGSFDIRSGLVTFDGNQRQNVGGLSALSGDNALTSAVVKNDIGISLSNELEVAETLTINKGNVVSENSSALIISNPSLTALRLNDVNSFIGTTLRKQLTANDSYDFRVGKDNRIATLNLTSVDVSGLWEAEYYNSDPGNHGFDPESFEAPLQFVSRNEFWRVSGPDGGQGGVTIRWDDKSGVSSDVNERDELRMVSWNDLATDAWEVAGSDIIDNGPGAGTITSDALLSFNEFTDGNYFTIGGTKVYNYPWLGTNSNWFDSNNWDSGKVPSINTEVEIPSQPSGGNYPIINGDAYVKDLVINSTPTDSATVTVNPGSSLEISNDLDNNGYLILKSTNSDLASLMLPETMTNKGEVKVDLTLAPDHYWYLSSPIKGTKGGWFQPVEPAGNGDHYVYVFEVVGNRWQWVQLDGSHLEKDIKKMQGIAAYYYTDATHLEYSGEVYNQDVTIRPNDPGFHLVGNPYPTAIDWENPAGWIREGFSNTIWSWIDFKGVRVIQTYNNNGDDLPGVWVLEPDGYNSATMSHIPPYQSVWMKQDTQDEVPLTVKRAARVKKSDAPLKSASGREKSFDLIRIKAVNEYTMDATVLYFNEQFVAGNSREDSEKRFNGSTKVPEVYTRINGKAMAINGHSLLSSDKEVFPLSVRNRLEGVVTLKVSLDEFDADYEVFLEDKEAGLWVDLKAEKEYTYTPVELGESHDRFAIHFEKVQEIPTNVAKPEEGIANDIKILGSKDNVYVHISPALLQTSDATIEVLDINGRLINSVNTKSSETDVQLPDVNGVYVVRVKAGGTVKTEKVVR